MPTGYSKRGRSPIHDQHHEREVLFPGAEMPSGAVSRRGVLADASAFALDGNLDQIRRAIGEG
ncbi:MAG: hypothetical protein AB7U66_18915, partial [Hyphomicrobiaceae bacterium]